MTPLRRKILALARKYDGAIMTVNQAMNLESTMGSMDDTLTDDEVWMFLSLFAQNHDTVPLTKSKKLVKVNVDKQGKVTTSPAPFSQS
jgi:hypothetical protein